MLFGKKKIDETIICKNEAGLYEYRDTGLVIEDGDKVFVIEEENIFSGVMEKVFYQKRENAEKHK